MYIQIPCSCYKSLHPCSASLYLSLLSHSTVMLQFLWQSPCDSRKTSLFPSALSCMSPSHLHESFFPPTPYPTLIIKQLGVLVNRGSSTKVPSQPIQLKLQSTYSFPFYFSVQYISVFLKLQVGTQEWGMQSFE